MATQSPASYPRGNGCRHAPPAVRGLRLVHSLAAAEVTVINGEAGLRFSKVFREDYLRVSRPQRYDGRGDAQVLDKFIAGLRIYLHIYTESEEHRMLLAWCFLEGEARQLWRSPCDGHE